MSKKNNLITLLIFLLAIPLVVIVGILIFREKHYSFVSLAVAVLSCVPLAYCFERKESSSKELVTLALLVAISAMGRFIFAFVPGFKPVTAITVIVALWLGKEAGFAVGTLSAVISNFYFGQGPWTPFQMLTWGVIGFVAGIMSGTLKKSKVLLLVFGFFAGIFYSLAMDVWTTIWADGFFNISRYLGAVLTALPVTAQYAVSNVIFLLLLAKPLGIKLERIKKKYGLFIPKNHSNKSTKVD